MARFAETAQDTPHVCCRTAENNGGDGIHTGVCVCFGGSHAICVCTLSERYYKQHLLRRHKHGGVAGIYHILLCLSPSEARHRRLKNGRLPEHRGGPVLV